MLILLLIVCTGLLVSNLYFHKRLLDENKQLKDQIKNHALILCKLVYHVGKDIEDYESVGKIYEILGKECDLNKFNV